MSADHADGNIHRLVPSGQLVSVQLEVLIQAIYQHNFQTLKEKSQLGRK